MKKLMVVCCALLLSLAGSAWAVPTSLVVRARAHDAKFVGTAVGTMAVAVRDFNTGRLLADGYITGGTGDTAKLMKEPVTRGKDIIGKGAAAFSTTLDIDHPTKIVVELDGPLAAGLDSHKESKTLWLLPGRDITGNGIIFDLYGLIVDPYGPVPHEFHKVGDKVRIAAHVSPMCGCPIRPGFLWDAADYTIKATVMKDGKVVADLPMSYAGKVGDFATEFTPEAGGTYSVVISAADKRNNQGAAIRSLVVVPDKMYTKITGEK